MPWKSEAQRRWGHANFSPERVAEWDQATTEPLPARVPKMKEATRKPGRKKGIARLVRLASLGCWITLWFLSSCAKPALSPTEESLYFAELLEAARGAQSCQEGLTAIAAVEKRWAPKFQTFARPVRQPPELHCDK